MNCLYNVLIISPLLLLALVAAMFRPQIHIPFPDTIPYAFVLKFERSMIASDLQFTVNCVRVNQHTHCYLICILEPAK